MLVPIKFEGDFKQKYYSNKEVTIDIIMEMGLVNLRLTGHTEGKKGNGRQ